MHAQSKMALNLN